MTRSKGTALATGLAYAGLAVTGLRRRPDPRGATVERPKVAAS
jgi:hypothetical protein